MKVLYVVFRALLGGHIMSAYTTSRKMTQLGYQCVFAGADGVMAEEIRKVMPFEEVEIPLCHKGRPTYFTWESIQAVKRIREIIAQHDIDLVHTFDARSYVCGYLAAFLENKPIICTLCGGEEPYFNLPFTSKIVVFSEEQRMKLVRKYHWSKERVVINMARMDFDELYDEKNFMDDAEWTGFGLSTKVPVVATISSFDSTKDRMICHMREAIEQVAASGTPCQFALIGGSGDRYQETLKWAEELNRGAGIPRVVLTGPVKRAFRLLRRATVVIGSGRSAFEGMCYGIPTMIVGARGYAGDVSESDIDAVAYYNFSGRNLDRDRPVQALTDRLVSLLNSPAERRVIGEFGRRYLLDNLDVVKGCERYAAIYQNALDEHRNRNKTRMLCSFGKCMVPIWVDNFTHEIRTHMEKVMRREGRHVRSGC